MPGLVPYLVPFDALRSFASSRDPNACMKIETLFKRELADEPGTDGALRRICMGEPAHRRRHALRLGARDPVRALRHRSCPTPPVANADDEWLMRVVDPVFDAWRVGDFVKLKRLVYGTWPIKIPHAEFPRGGSIDAAELARALEVIRRGALPKFDREVITVIGEVRGWLEACVARNAGLVAFYY